MRLIGLTLAFSTAVTSCGLFTDSDPAAEIARCLRVRPDSVIVEVGDDGVIENVIFQVDKLGREIQPAEVDRCIEATGLPVRE